MRDPWRWLTWCYCHWWHQSDSMMVSLPPPPSQHHYMLSLQHCCQCQQHGIIAYITVSTSSVIQNHRIASGIGKMVSYPALKLWQHCLCWHRNTTSGVSVTVLLLPSWCYCWVQHLSITVTELLLLLVSLHHYQYIHLGRHTKIFFLWQPYLLPLP